MNTLYIDSSSGASGDMILAAFVSLGVPKDYLVGELKKLGLNEFNLDIQEKKYNGYQVTDVDVLLLDEKNLWINPYSGNYRNYKQIKEIIERSTLSDNAKLLSRKIFDIKARAEAKVHGVKIEEVKFHEAGAVDSIVDVVGTAICFDYLNIDKAISNHIPTGYGTIKCACGILPVPAPAVAEILINHAIPNYKSNIEQELLTPTGAAIMTGIVDEFVKDWGEVIYEKEGFGIGKRNTGLEPLKFKLCKKNFIEKVGDKNEKCSYSSRM